MHQDVQPQPFDIRDLRLDIEVEADNYQEPISNLEPESPDNLESEELPF